MDVYYITFRSVTVAQQGEKLLAANGIRIRLMRTPRWMEERGCGYCLRLRTGKIDRAAQLLRSGNVEFRRVYRQNTDASLKEVQL